MGLDDLGTELGNLMRTSEDSTRPQLGKGGEPITWLEIYPQDLRCENINIFTDTAIINGSYLIWDHNGSNHLWDVGSWATQSTKYEEPEFQGRVRAEELKIHQFHLEDFKNTDNKDAPNTEGFWEDSGSLTLTTGSATAQSLKILGSDVRLGSFNRVKMSIYGSNLDNVVGSVSLDGGQNWEKIDFDVEKEFKTEYSGSDVRWRLALI